MVEYLNSGDVLFPNAILLALSPRATFARSRGPTPFGLTPSGDSGVLRLPRLSYGSKCAWIVDGQQRSTALARAGDGNLPVPVLALDSADLHVNRLHIILVKQPLQRPQPLGDE